MYLTRAVLALFNVGLQGHPNAQHLIFRATIIRRERAYYQEISESYQCSLLEKSKSLSNILL